MEYVRDMFAGAGIMFIILIAVIYASFQMRKDKKK
jgi:hypothetical protein